MLSENDDIKLVKSFGMEHLEFTLDEANLFELLKYDNSEPDETPNVIDDILRPHVGTLTVVVFKKLREIHPEINLSDIEIDESSIKQSRTDNPERLYFCFEARVCTLKADYTYSANIYVPLYTTDFDHLDSGKLDLESKDAIDSLASRFRQALKEVYPDSYAELGLETDDE